MTDNVTPLRPVQQEEPEDQIWACGHCGFEAFELHRDGTTLCRGCGNRSEHPDGSWTEWNDSKTPPENASRTTTQYRSSVFAHRSIFNDIDEDTTVLVTAANNGKIRAWSAYDHEATPAEKATVRYLLAQATTLILGEPPIERPADALPDDD